MSRFLSLLGNLIAVALVAAVIFLFIYFLFPEVSLRYFGITFREERAIERMIDQAVDDLDVDESERGELKSFISSKEGESVVSSFVSLTAKGGNRLYRNLKKVDLKKLLKEAQSYVDSGRGTVDDFFKTQEAESALKGVSL